MKITADTNLLVRLLVKDDLAQWKIAKEAIESASVVALTLPMLCELVWVLRSFYKMPPERIVETIVALTEIANAEMNPSAIEAGLQMLRAGGDFADGVIAFEGQWLGGEVFVSFDRKAIQLAERYGHQTKLLTV